MPGRKTAPWHPMDKPPSASISTEPSLTSTNNEWKAEQMEEDHQTAEIRRSETGCGVHANIYQEGPAAEAKRRNPETAPEEH